MIAKRIQTKINNLRKDFYHQAQGKEQLLRLIAETEVSEQVYNSNAIENSTLTIEETEKVLLEIDLDRYISQRELFEAKNLARVVSYIDAMSEKSDLTIESVLLLHKMLLSNIQDDIAGRLRQDKEFVRVGDHVAPAPALVEELLHYAILDFKAQADQHIVTRIARFHLSFEHTHPFVDGNGRIGRVLNNYLLLKEGYVPINIKFADREQYYHAFREYNLTNSTDVMEEMVATALIDSYHKRLAYLQGQRIVLLNVYAEENNLSHSNLLNKAKRQTIPAFRERGKWKIGVDSASKIG